MKAAKTIVTIQRPVTEEVVTVTMTVRQAQILKQFIGRVDNVDFVNTVNEANVKMYSTGITLPITTATIGVVDNPDLVNHRLFEALAEAIRK